MVSSDLPAAKSLKYHHRGLARRHNQYDMPTPVKSKETTLRVAISGGGPAGLAAAIALREVPGVEVTIYEQATELREVGAGIRIGFNSWKVLELLGVEDKVYGHKKVVHEHR